MEPADLLAGLDDEQTVAVTAPRGPVCVLAGAGTGKTRTITHRIAYQVQSGHISPNQVLAVTFTARAAGELRSRLRTLGVDGAQAVTFHAAAFRQLRYFWPQVVGDQQWNLLDNKLRFVAQAARRVGVGGETETFRDLAGEIEWAKASLIAAADYPTMIVRNNREAPMSPETIAKVYEAYEHIKTQAQAVDFDDLLLHTTAILEENSHIAEEFRERYRCFVVDEYQDVTPLQQRLLNAWLGDRDDLTVVGDANQTIYSFTGASPRPLLDFTRRFPEATVVRLVRDYRSTPEVVSLANKVIGAAVDRPAGSRLRLIGQRPQGTEPTFTEYTTEADEGAAVAVRVKKLMDAGVPVKEIAILYRVNAQSEIYEQALSEADIPYVVRGGERFFDRREVKQALAALRVASQTRGAVIAQVKEVLSGLGFSEQPPVGGVARDRWNAVQALVELAEEFIAVEPDADLSAYVTELDRRAAAQHSPTLAGVTLASLHAAKGLEWDAVFLVGLTEGTMPIQHAGDNRQAIEEERRLLYVGITRAREQLFLSWSLQRNSESQRKRRRSRFLYDVAPAGHSAHRSTSNAHSKENSRSTDALDIDETLFARLKAWRTERSQQLKVPDFVIFTDRTLETIAAQRPIDERALVSIPGIGATKLHRFGAEVLALIQQSAVIP